MLLAAVVCLAWMAATLPATAITAEDVMKKMGHEQRAGYISGLIDMLAYETAVAGDNKTAICITDTFYRQGREAALERLLAVFDKYADKRPEILVAVLAKQLCKNE